jgi:hypothetical protein
MARYCFHFTSKDHFVEDRDGVELADLAAAHAHAVKLIHQTIRNVLAGSGWDNWKIDISDESGRTPLTVLFPSAAPRGHKPGGVALPAAS